MQEWTYHPDMVQPYDPLSSPFPVQPYDPLSSPFPMQPYDPLSSHFPMLDIVRWLTLHNHHDGVIAKIWIMCFVLSVWVSSLWLLGSSSPGVNQLGLKWTNTPLSSAKVESEWSHISVPRYAFMMCKGTTLPCLRVCYFTKGNYFCSNISFVWHLYLICVFSLVLIYLELCLEVLQMQCVLIDYWPEGFFFLVVFFSLSR